MITSTQTQQPQQQNYNTFHQDLEFSHRESTAPYWRQAFIRYFKDPNITVLAITPTHNVNDLGIDLRVHVPSRDKSYYFDTKVHRYNPNSNYPPDDKIFLEYEHTNPDGSWKKDGWIRDSSKQCDYIAYAKQSNKVVYIFPFTELRTIWEENEDTWLSQCPKPATPNWYNGELIYRSHCALVSAEEIYNKLNKHFTIPVPEEFWNNTTYN